MTIFLGLTGSIGMGKSTTAQFFKDAGIPVYDSDATVHRLYKTEAVSLIENAFPGTTNNECVDRGELGKRVVGNDIEMKKLEAIIHPMVRREETKFRERQIADRKKMAVLDVPLLFETDGSERVDGIVVVTAPPEVQQKRVLAREGMTVEKFNSILARQMLDEEKRSKADFIVDTSKGMKSAKLDVLNIIEIVKSGNWSKDNKQHA